MGGGKYQASPRRLGWSEVVELLVRTGESHEQLHRHRAVALTLGLDLQAIHRQCGPVSRRQLESQRIAGLLEALGGAGKFGRALEIEDRLDQLPTQARSEWSSPGAEDGIVRGQLGVPDDHVMETKDDMHSGGGRGREDATGG